MTNSSSLDMTLLRRKIVEGITHIHRSIEETKAVLFVGDSGVGKTTLLSHLIGRELSV